MRFLRMALKKYVRSDDELTEGELMLANLMRKQAGEAPLERRKIRRKKK